MPDAAVILLLLVLATGVVISFMRLAARPARNSPATRLPSMALIRADEGLGSPQQTVGQVLSIATERPNEVYLFGPAALLDEYGTVLATTPPQLAKHATRLRGGTDTARSYGEPSGRLVLVEDATASALRSGTMMHDKYGEIPAHVLRDDGKISSVTRLRRVGGLGASLASITNAMSAMAMQAQLDRIERQLSAISHGVEEVHRRAATRVARPHPRRPGRPPRGVRHCHQNR